MLNKIHIPLLAVVMTLAPVAQSVLAQSSQVASTASTAAFDVFMRSDIMQALAEGDHDRLNADRFDSAVYLGKLIGVLEAPEAWYRMGQEGVLSMDPRLGIVLASKLATDELVYNEAMSRGIGMVMGGLEAFTEKRAESVDSGTIDPSGEAAALVRGLVGSTGGLGETLAAAEYDANRLMLLAQTDPVAFSEIHESIRSFIYFGL